LFGNEQTPFLERLYLSEQEHQAIVPTADSVSTDNQSDWQEAYRAALLEVDPAKLPGRVEQAYEAIHLYLEVARQNNSNGAEYQALADALANLRVLRREAGLPINACFRKQPELPGPNQ
jgi:ABC-type branched-subunit amino acid transport system substrate-binding protein